MTEEIEAPRCFMCGNVERDGVALVRPAERTDLWYDGCHAGYVELQPQSGRRESARCQWCSGGWLQQTGVYSCTCRVRCSCPECSVAMPPVISEHGEIVVTGLVDAQLWDGSFTQVAIVSDLENMATQEAERRGLLATLPGNIRIIHPADPSVEGRTHPEIGPDQILVSIAVELAPQARP